VELCPSHGEATPWTVQTDPKTLYIFLKYFVPVMNNASSTTSTKYMLDPPLYAWYSSIFQLKYISQWQ